MPAAGRDPAEYARWFADPGLYRFRTRCRRCDLRFGEMGRLGPGSRFVFFRLLYLIMI